MKYSYEVYIQLPDGHVRTRPVRATSAEHAERIVGRELPQGHKIIGVACQFKQEEIKK